MQSFHPMALLLKHEGYPPAVVAATLIHGFLLFILFHNPVMSNELVNIDEPIYINATTAEQNPQRLRRIQESGTAANTRSLRRKDSERGMLRLSVHGKKRRDSKRRNERLRGLRSSVVKESWHRGNNRKLRPKHNERLQEQDSPGTSKDRKGEASANRQRARSGPTRLNCKDSKQLSITTGG